jgi:hypothetical protein
MNSTQARRTAKRRMSRRLAVAVVILATAVLACVPGIAVATQGGFL